MTMTQGRPGENESNGKVPQAQPSPPPVPSPATPKPNRSIQPEPFEHPLMLQQSSQRSRAILWTLMGVATVAVLWACFSKIEEAIPAQGKLEPQGAVSDVQVPVNGVVKKVYVQDGQHVESGDLLLSLDPTVSQAQLDALQKVRTNLTQETQFYQSQLSGQTKTVLIETASPQLLGLIESRSTLTSENQLFRAQLSGSTQGVALTPEQQERFQFNQEELNTRVVAAQLETEQLSRQLSQTQVKLATAQKTLVLNQKILDNVIPLAETGAISQIQYLKQQQEADSNQSDVSQLLQEQNRLRAAILASQAKVQNTVALDRKDLMLRMAENDKRIAEINSQLTKAIVENNRKVAELDSQISQAQQTLKYGDVKAPVEGTVFELKAHAPGFVATTTEPILKVVPDDALVAKVSITNRDIGFVREGMSVDVRIDSFPFSEFGDIKGTLVWIGSDALPPTQIQPYYTFPAKIKLQRQVLTANGREIHLQSGMSLSANIKLRQRTVMSIFLDQFTRASESLKFVR
jgi:hemolysin D